MRQGLLSLVILICGAASALAADNSRVIIISMDGLPAYLLNDPNAVLPNVRALAAKGVVAEGMTVSNPSVTWPNHTSIVTGVRPMKHGVLFNGVLEKRGLGLPVKVDPAKEKSELVHAVTLYDVLHEAGISTGGINWPCTRNSGTLDIDFPDVPDSLTHSTPSFLDELKAQGILPDENRNNWGKLSAPARDYVWTQAACHAIRQHQTRYLLVHLLNIDGSHHRYGPQTPGGYSAVAYADACVGEIVRAVKEAGLEDETTFMIVSDHGFITIPKTIQPNVVFRKAGLLTVEGNSVATARVHAVPEGGIAMVYLTVPDTAEADRQKVIELFSQHEGIAAVVEPKDFAKYGLPQPDEYEAMADLILSAKDGYAFNGTATGDDAIVASTTTLGTHGFLSDNPKMNAVFIAAGRGVHPGAKLGQIENIDIAPTAAKLLNVPFKTADGRVLEEIFAEGARPSKE